MADFWQWYRTRQVPCTDDEEEVVPDSDDEEMIMPPSESAPKDIHPVVQQYIHTLHMKLKEEQEKKRVMEGELGTLRVKLKLLKRDGLEIAQEMMYRGQYLLS
ncbi:hypothetical protein H0H92_001072, partial [Tricholoma furcatifolium]